MPSSNCLCISIFPLLLQLLEQVRLSLNCLRLGENVFNLDVVGLRGLCARVLVEGDGLEVDCVKLEVGKLDVEGAILEFNSICPDGEIGLENDNRRSQGLFEVQFGDNLNQNQFTCLLLY